MPGSTRDKLGPWKSYKTGEPGGLFHVGDDLGEEKDLSDSDPERALELRKMLKEIREQKRSAPNS